MAQKLTILNNDKGHTLLITIVNDPIENELRRENI